MPIFMTTKGLVLFAHVPRCAGTAIEAHLRERFGALAFLDPQHSSVPTEALWTRTSPQHADRAALARLFPRGFLTRSFAVVRHPARRLRSVFLFHKHVEGTIPQDQTFDAWLDELASRPDHAHYDNHSRPMDDLVPEDAVVFRLEDGLDPLVAWLDELACTAAGPRTIDRVNGVDQRPEAAATVGQEGAAELTAGQLDLVARLHAADYRRFGYATDPRAASDVAPGVTLALALDAAPDALPDVGGPPARTVVLHYHLFKNAGTSVDRILTDSFGDRWVTREFLAGSEDNSAAVVAWISETLGAVAFSTHTAMGPLPPLDGVDVLSVLLLRDPLERIRSAYQFERRQEADTFGARLAKVTDLEGYARARIGRPGDRQCRNFQTHRLASLSPGPGPELERATRAMEAITVLGLVERFDDAMGRLAEALKPSHPEFRWQPVAANRSEAGAPMPPDLAAFLAEHNADDAELLDRARRWLSR